MSTIKSFYSWLNIFLKDKGGQLSKPGDRTGDGLGSKHDIDLATGFWSNPGYSANKPTRWLFNTEGNAQGATAFWPSAVVNSTANIGYINNSSGNALGLVFRLLPLVRKTDGTFHRDNSLECRVLFVLQQNLTAGDSSEPVGYNTATGVLTYEGAVRPYLFAALIGLQPPGFSVNVDTGGQPRDIHYGEVTAALAAAIHAAPIGQAPAPMPIFDLSAANEVERLKEAIEDAWAAAGPLPAPAAGAAAADEAEEDAESAVETVTLDIPPHPDLLGVDPGVYRQINAALKSGKQHLMFYGPPGTGKTTLARWVAETLTDGKWTLITGSADWSSQDIIGGYQPTGGGNVAFFKGALLRDFDRPLIIDELNRCDIDKVIGPLFTVLSGQQTTLPYRLDITKANSAQYVILPSPKVGAAEHECAPGSAWRLIATINSIDKASLYQMSYALSRRFGWVYVDAPRDCRAFLVAFMEKHREGFAVPAADAPCPLAAIWQAIGQVRPMGAAPIIDALKAIEAMEPGADFFAVASEALQEAMLDAIDMVLLPMLDGIALQDAIALAGSITAALGLGGAKQQRIEERLKAVAV